MEGCFSTANRKGLRELGNLQFDVNYDENHGSWDCSHIKNKIMSWNIRGGGFFSKRTIKEMVCRENPDILILQEVKNRQLTRHSLAAYGDHHLKNGFCHLHWKIRGSFSSLGCENYEGGR